MVNKLAVVAIITLVFSGAIYNVVLAQTAFQLSREDEMEVVSVNNSTENQTHHVEQFIQLLEVVDLDTPLVSAGAENLAQAFAKAATNIQDLEKAGDFEQGEILRTDIQNAIGKHMERPGALEADISDNIDAYSRYLTETLIAQVGQ
ncbi:MAG: hypothetical protein ACK42D_01600 [Candidatus Paceibacteria bacterium]